MQATAMSPAEQLAAVVRQERERLNKERKAKRAANMEKMRLKRWAGPRAEKKAVACRLRERRKAVGLSQAHVAAAAGATTSQYSQWERGDIQPRVTTAVRIARFLGVPVEDLWPAEGA